MNKILITFIFFLILFYNSDIYSQETGFSQVPDTLKSKTFNELYNIYLKNEDSNKAISLLAANAYLEKAKKQKNNISISKGYKYLGSLQDDDLNLVYLDSAIAITDGSLSSFVQGKLYYTKGTVLYKKRAFRKSIDNLLIANKEARKFNYSDLIYNSNYMIAVLTDRIGNHQDAINILKEYPSYLKEKKISKIDTILQLETYFALAIAFYKLKKLDSSNYYNNYGLKKALEYGNDNFYNYFILSSGVALYHQGKYQQALDSINKAITYLKKIDQKPNLAVSYFYKGKILYKQNLKKEGLIYLKKLDTIFQQQNDILPETREGYEMIIDYYKQNNDTKNQLIYTQRLLEVDKVLNQNYRHLQTNIIKDYYTPLLISKKVESENKNSRKIIYTITLLLTLSIAGLLYYYFRQKRYKRKFNLLIQSNNQSNPKSKEQKNHLQELKISKDVIENIINGLQTFEKEKRFLNSNYTLTSLAKELNTNSSYLSKVINVMKHKNFSTYLSDLRIEYVIEEIKSNYQFRLYSIKAIAEEIGFKNTESFSKAFHKKTGIYPSFFIKEISRKKV